jgi:hypothetical protein
MSRRLLATAAAATAAVTALAPTAASAAPTVLSTGYAVRDARGLRQATGACLATGVGAVAVVLTECGFAGEDTPYTALTVGATAVATFTAPIGEQPKTLCWAGYAVGTDATTVPFSGCTVVS